MWASMLGSLSRAKACIGFLFFVFKMLQCVAFPVLVHCSSLILFKAILDKLQAIGHKVVPEVEDSAFQGITRSADGRVFANMDFRKGGGFGGV